MVRWKDKQSANLSIWVASWKLIGSANFSQGVLQAKIVMKKFDVTYYSDTRILEPLYQTVPIGNFQI